MGYMNGAQVLNVIHNTNYHEWQEICNATVTPETAGGKSISIQLERDFSEFTEFRFVLELGEYGDASQTFSDVRIHAVLGNATLFYAKNDIAGANKHVITGKLERVNDKFFTSIYTGINSENGLGGRITTYCKASIAENFNPDKVRLTIEGDTTYKFPAGTTFYVEGRK